jgi:hypothetical protein
VANHSRALESPVGTILETQTIIRMELLMNRRRTPIAATSLVACFLTVIYAASPVANESTPVNNSYYVFTKSLGIDDSGVATIPSRFRWSVETCVAGFDLHGNALPDSRVMLRLYDPDHNFTAMTAQMDLETAENIQLQLADIIAKKRKNPGFQHRPDLYDQRKIPTLKIEDIDENGVAIIEREPKQAKK